MVGLTNPEDLFFRNDPLDLGSCIGTLSDGRPCWRARSQETNMYLTRVPDRGRKYIAFSIFRQIEQDTLDLL